MALAANARSRDVSLQRLARVNRNIISAQKGIRGVKERRGVAPAPGAEIEYARGGTGEPEGRPVGGWIRPRVPSIVKAAAIVTVVAFRDRRLL